MFHKETSYFIKKNLRIKDYRKRIIMFISKHIITCFKDIKSKDSNKILMIESEKSLWKTLVMETKKNNMHKEWKLLKITTRLMRVAILLCKGMVKDKLKEGSITVRSTKIK